MDQAKPMADQPDDQTSCGRSKEDHHIQTKYQSCIGPGCRL